MKRSFYRAIILFAALYCALSFSACISAPSTQNAVPAKTQKPTGKAEYKGEPLRVEVVPQRKQTDRFEYSVELPTFPDYPALNVLIRDVYNRRFADFERDSVENYKAGAKIIHSFFMNWEAAELSDSIISIKIETYSYTGGANGTDYIDTVNWLPAQKKQLSFEEIPAFLGLNYTKTKWIDYLSRNSGDVLENELNRKKSPGLSKFIAEGTRADEQNFQNITISGKKITVWFEKYQAAPGSAGVVSAVINTANAQ